MSPLLPTKQIYRCLCTLLVSRTASVSALDLHFVLASCFVAPISFKHLSSSFAISSSCSHLASFSSCLPCRHSPLIPLPLLPHIDHDRNARAFPTLKFKSPVGGVGLSGFLFQWWGSMNKAGVILLVILWVLIIYQVV